MGKGKVGIHFTDKALENNPADSAHEVSDLTFIEDVNRPHLLPGHSTVIFGKPYYVVSHVACEDEIVVKKDHVRLDVKESERYLAVAEGLK
jgi:hypothetical protein